MRTPPHSLRLLLHTLFWVFVLAILIINYWNSGTIWTGNISSDFHWSYITYLAGMSSLDFLPGVDFISSHGVFVPFVLGLYMRLVGVSQLNMAFATCVLVFIQLIVLYKISRFLLPFYGAWIVVVIALSSFTGREVPWFNDTTMVFVVLATYLLVSFVSKPQKYKLLVIGFIIFLIPYMRQQTVVISLLFCCLPLFLAYFKLYSVRDAKVFFTYIFGSFLLCNSVFLLYVALTGNLSVLWDSLFVTPAAAQPFLTQSLEIKLLALIKSLFDYTVSGVDYYGPFAGYLTYWIIPISVSLFFVMRMVNIKYSESTFTQADYTRFICAIVTLATIVLNYPINEELRNKAHFIMGVMLSVDLLFLLVYNNRIKIFSLVCIFVMLIFVNHSRISFAYGQFMRNFDRVVCNSGELRRISDSGAFNGLLLSRSLADNVSMSINALRSAEKIYPDAPVIFDGSINNSGIYVYLYFSARNKGLQTAEPYYFHKPFFEHTRYRHVFKKYISEKLPIVINCNGSPLPSGYVIFFEVPDSVCKIIVDGENALYPPYFLYPLNGNEIVWNWFSGIKFVNWNRSERSHRWSYDNRASILFAIENNNLFRGTLDITFSTFGSQSFNLFLNGVLIESFEAKKFDGTVNVLFNKEILRNGTNVLEFDIPNANNPGDPEEPKLGIALKHFILG